MPQKRKPAFKVTTSEGFSFDFYWSKLKNHDGVCENPTGRNPKICVNENLKERRKMAVIVEELTHAFFYLEPEYRVRKHAATITRILYKSGWRKVK